MLQNKRQEINPRQIKSVDSILKKREESPVLVSGIRHKNLTGFTVKGTECSTFETYSMYMLPQTATAKVMHPAKDLVVRVISGVGQIQVWIDGELKVSEVKAGEECHFKPSIPYRICNVGYTGLDMLVLQSAKYISRLEELEPATAADEKDADRALDQVQTVEQRANNTILGLGRSKAVEQMQQLKRERGQEDSAPLPAAVVERSLQINARAEDFDYGGAG